MDILKTSIEWTKAEVFSSMFFIAFGIVFLATSAGFWQIGKTEVAKAYVIPMAVAGGLLLVIGAGIFIQHQARVTSFAEAYNSDAPAFIASEIARAEKVLGDYRIAVYMVIPIIVAVSVALFIFLEGPLWRAIFVTTIAMMAVILIVDTNASARLEIYKDRLKAVENPG